MRSTSLRSTGFGVGGVGGAELYIHRREQLTFYVIYQDLMPIHCCAMQGRIDAIHALLFFDTEGIIRQNLEMEGEVFRL